MRKFIYLAYIYFMLTIRHFYRRQGFLRAGALAYSLMFAIIPLFASMSIFVSKLYQMNKSRIQIFLNQDEINLLVLKFLPYSTHEINQYLLQFVRNAKTLGLIGTLILGITVVLLVGVLENIFNITWGTKRHRPLYRKIGLILFIIFIFSITFSLSIKLPRLDFFQQPFLIKIPARVVSFFLLIVSFSILYYLIPNARITRRSAFLGGILAATLYETGRAGFRYYLITTFTYNKIYGSLGLIPIFVISLFMLSLIIILGGEMSYVAQHYRHLAAQYVKKIVRRRNRARNTRNKDRAAQKAADSL